MLPNPYVLLAGVAVWLASLVGAFYFGTSYEQGQQAKAVDKVRLLREAIRADNAEIADRVAIDVGAAILNLRPIHRTINNEVRHEREVHTKVLDNPDCAVPASTVRVRNNAIRSGLGDDRPRTDGAAAPVPEAGAARRNEAATGR